MRILTAAMLALGLFLVQPAAGGEIERVEAWLENLDTLRAGFDQVLFSADLEPVQESSGVLLIERPGQFRWEYRTPFEQLIVSDGENIWMYDAELLQATVRRYDETIASSPAMLLSGDGDIDAVFEGAGSHRAEDIDWVTLKPKRKETDFQRIRLGFSGATLAMMELTDSLDQVTQIRFYDVERNSDVPKGAFAFKPPAGVDVIDETDLGLD